MTYHKRDENETEVEKEKLIKGYHYGKAFVPWQKTDDANMKLTAEKCLKVICFTSKDNVRRHMQNAPCTCSGIIFCLKVAVVHTVT